MVAAPPAAPPRVLVIEDQFDSGDCLRVLLSIHGCDVRVAGNAREAISLAMDWKPRVVISDIGLPDLDGWQLGRQMRAALGDGAFLVAVTGRGHPEDLKRSLASGYNAHLTKPTDLKALLRLVGV